MSEGDALLKAYGFKEIGSVSVEADEFRIRIDDVEAAQAVKCVYAFVVDREIVRIGSCKSKLSIRLSSWQRDVTKALQGQKSPTPQSEAEGWRQVLSPGPGAILARPGTEVETPIGRINCYLAEEAALIEKHRPRFCRR